MAVDIHIKIDTIPGMSGVKGYEGQIKVEGFGWGMTQTTNFSSSSGGGAGRVNMEDLTFVHAVDKATPKLMIACCQGTHLKEAVLVCCKAGGDAAVPFLKITLTDVIVAAVHPSGKNDGDTPTETVKLAFREYKTEYQEQDNNGAKKGGPVISGFDVQKNAKTA
ncbi:MAG: type VI secretion system tube protein Hcp [Rubrivivax sp.]|nr:type VI secretion system tube protein Hcp [Rubrivivax sp.]